MSRRVISLTDAQQHALLFAIKHMAEDGHPEFHRSWGAIERQVGGEYTPAERTSIYKFAIRLADGAKP